MNNFVCLVNYQAKERSVDMKIILKQMKGALCAVALLLTSTATMGAVEIKDLFMNEPGVVFELLPEATRISMVSYYENEQDVYATNRAGNSSHIIDLKPRHMSIEMSAGRKVELALLIQGKDSAIMVIEHFSIPYPDAVVTFYDTVENRQAVQGTHAGEFHQTRNAGTGGARHHTKCVIPAHRL